MRSVPLFAFSNPAKTQKWKQLFLHFQLFRFALPLLHLLNIQQQPDLLLLNHYAAATALLVHPYLPLLAVLDLSLNHSPLKFRISFPFIRCNFSDSSFMTSTVKFCLKPSFCNFPCQAWSDDTLSHC